jgi:hypothetical protein
MLAWLPRRCPVSPFTSSLVRTLLTCIAAAIARRSVDRNKEEFA